MEASKVTAPAEIASAKILAGLMVAAPISGGN